MRVDACRSTFCRHAEGCGVWWDDSALTAPRAGRRPVIRDWLRSVDHVRLNLLASGPEWLWAEIWAHILPDDLTGGCDLEEAAVHTLVDEGITVGQAPGIADERAVKSPFGGIAVAAGILPDDLLRHRIDLQRARAGEDFEGAGDLGEKELTHARTGSSNPVPSSRESIGLARMI